jgi:O-antigen/teichoic acid export membrane protein
MSYPSKGIISSLSSGVLLRVAGAVLNFMAVPIALRTLGQEKYAAFAALLGLAGWLTIGSLGLGKVTAMSVVGLHDDEEKRGTLFWQAVVSTCIVVAAVSVIAFVPFKQMSLHLVTNTSNELEQELNQASYYCFSVFTLCAIAAPFEGRYAGLLRVDYCNWVRLAGQILAIAALVLVTQFWADMLALCFAVTFGTTASALWFIIKGIREAPPPKSFTYSLRDSLPLLRQGIGFLASSLAILFYGGGSLPLFAITFGTEQLATAGVMARLVQMYCSLIAILLIPLGSALKHAIVAGEVHWIRTALLSSNVVMLSTAIVSAVGLVLFGQPLITHWTGTQLPFLSDWLLPTAAQLVAISWCYLWVYACFAKHGSLPVAKLAGTEILTIALLYYVLGHHIPPAWSLYVSAGTMMLLSGTILPVIVLRDSRVHPSYRSNRSNN